MNVNNNSQSKNKTSFISQVLGNLKTDTRIVLIMIILLGIAYPIFLVVIGQIILPFQSNGSILEQDGKKVGIPENTLRTLLDLNIEQNKVTNGLFFAPYYVNVLEVNLELVRQYPQVYNMSSNSSSIVSNE